MAEATTPNERWDAHDQRVFGSWLGSLSLTFLIAGLIILPTQCSHRQRANLRHEARFDPRGVEPGMTPADFELPPGAHPARVAVGVYVERIFDLSIRDAKWSVDFQIWFRWKDADIDPSDGFQVVDGWIDSSVKQVDRTVNGDRYVRYRVIASITKPFDIRRFPCDDHLLTLNIECPGLVRSSLLFEPDAASSVSSRVQIPAYEIYRKEIAEKPHSYSSSLGEPGVPTTQKTTFSQFKLGIWIRRPSWGFYVKMFQALYVAVAIASLAMLVKPTHVDPRFGLSVGGLFAAVASSYIASSLIPDTGVLTLADIVNFLGIAAIFLTVLESTLSLYLLDHLNKESLSKWLDRASFVVILVAYALLNLLIPIAASNSW